MTKDEFYRLFEQACSEVHIEGRGADGAAVSGKRTLKEWAGGTVEGQEHAVDAAKHGAGATLKQIADGLKIEVK